VNPVSLIEPGLPGHAFQKKRQKGDVPLLRDLPENRGKRFAIGFSHIGRREHSREEYADLRMPVARAGNDTIKILPGIGHRKPPQGIIRPQSDNQHIHRLRQHPVNSPQTTCGGVTADPGVAHLHCQSLLPQLLFQNGGPGRGRVQPVARRQAVAKADDTGRLPRQRNRKKQPQDDKPGESKHTGLISAHMDMTITQTTILKLEGVGKSFPVANGRLQVLSGITLQLRRGESVAITGPSGSGKTTLLGLAAGLDDPSEGDILLLGHSLPRLNEEDRTTLRRESVGFVFQNFQLIPSLTALENVAVPLELMGRREVEKESRAWLNRVGLADRSDHYPAQLSGGEQQRVAIARASVHQPAVLFADEPTGNLDGETSEKIEEILFQAHRETGNTLIIVTHDRQLADKTDRILPIRRGQLASCQD